eukprot:364729-Chlamydomonas_euryale.AAC.3
MHCLELADCFDASAPYKYSLWLLAGVKEYSRAACSKCVVAPCHAWHCVCSSEAERPALGARLSL